VVLERDGDTPGNFGYSDYLVGPDTVLTCWHGWEDFSRRGQVAIFGHVLHGDGDYPADLPSAQVLRIAAYPARQPPPASERGACSDDWVLLRLEHAVTHLGALPPPRFEAPRLGRRVYTLGYPGGLPLKLADGATISSVAEGVFRTDLDTFRGNSGSAVFDAESHALLGIVVAGQPDRGDYMPLPAQGCYVARHVDRDRAGQISVPAGCFAPAGTR